MIDIFNDDRVVLTLDAGGTNFVFGALQRGQAICEPIRLDAKADNLEHCLANIRTGFQTVIDSISEPAQAISFAFPGPADYPQGIIGDLGNLPGFRGGVPLKDILEETFKIPVFINNDGDLYAYGEALGGILPEVNKKLAEAGSSKRYKNLVGLTLGTGFGGGIVRNNELFIGDNSIAGEVWLFSNRYGTKVNAEEVVSTRSVQRIYTAEAGLAEDNELMPFDIYQIGIGAKAGNQAAALKAYELIGTALGDTIANLITLTDGLIVIGGGITGASELYMPAVLKELQSRFQQGSGETIPRLVQKVYNLDEESEDFYKRYAKEVLVPGTNRQVSYDPVPRVGIATSKIGASQAISLGAYAFALNELSLR